MSGVSTELPRAALLKSRLGRSIGVLHRAGIEARYDLYMSCYDLQEILRRQWLRAEQTLPMDRLAELIDALGESCPKKPPMDVDLVLGPPRIDPTRDRDDSTCGVCLEPVSLDEPIFSLRCRHVFHVDCLRDWVRKGCKDTCPMDRGTLGRADDVELGV